MPSRTNCRIKGREFDFHYRIHRREFWWELVVSEMVGNVKKSIIHSRTFANKRKAKREMGASIKDLQWLAKRTNQGQ